MAGLVLDAGALIAVDRGDRMVLLRLRIAKSKGIAVRTNAMAVAQVWRDDRGRQAVLATVMKGVDVHAVAPEAGRVAGLVLAAAGLDDAIDATVALLAEDGDTVLTSDPGDLRRLLKAAGIRAAVVAC
ncbi:MAG: hypothetical protein ACT4P1_06730 [Sporichthyaceae bacterium]